MNGQSVEALWDTGAQVSVIPESFWKSVIPDVKMREVGEWVDSLQLKAANGSVIPYIGWVEVTFDLEAMEGPSHQLQVPFLVTSHELPEPIIGFNVIREMVISSNDLPGITNALVASFPNSQHAVPRFVSLLQADIPDDLGPVRVGRQPETVPSRQSTLLTIRVRPGPIREKTTVLFEPDRDVGLPEGLEMDCCLVQLSPGSSCRIQIPVHNQSEKDVTLPRHTNLGKLTTNQSHIP